MIFTMNIGKKLKKLRNAAGLSQEDIASALKIKRTTYAAYETNRSGVDVTLLQQVAKYYKVAISDFKDERESSGQMSEITIGELASLQIKNTALLYVILDAQAELLAGQNSKRTVMEVRSSLEQAVQRREEDLIISLDKLKD